MTESADESGTPSGTAQCLSKLRDGLREHTLLLVNPTQVQVRLHIARVQVDRLAKLFQGLVVMPAKYKTRPSTALMTSESGSVSSARRRSAVASSSRPIASKYTPCHSLAVPSLGLISSAR